MNLYITRSQVSAPVTALILEGVMDGTNYMSLVEEAERLHAAGTRDLILDLGGLVYISSAGISALHRVALLFRGERTPDQVEGWGAYHAIDRDRDSGAQQHIRLSGVNGKVLEVLEMVGFTRYFLIFADLDQAAASFLQPAVTG